VNRSEWPQRLNTPCAVHPSPSFNIAPPLLLTPLSLTFGIRPHKEHEEARGTSPLSEVRKLASTLLPRPFLLCSYHGSKINRFLAPPPPPPVRKHLCVSNRKHDLSAKASSSFLFQRALSQNAPQNGLGRRRRRRRRRRRGGGQLYLLEGREVCLNDFIRGGVNSGRLGAGFIRNVSRI